MIAPFKASLKHGGGIHLFVTVLHVNYEYENFFFFILALLLNWKYKYIIKGLLKHVKKFKWVHM